MPQCSVLGCAIAGSHRFPTDKNLRKQWCVAVGREDKTKKGQLWIPGPSARVCRRHFKESDYIDTAYHGKKLKLTPHVHTCTYCFDIDG